MVNTVPGSSYRFTLIYGLCRTPIDEHGTVSDVTSMSLGFWGLAELRENGVDNIRQNFIFEFYKLPNYFLEGDLVFDEVRVLLGEG